MYFFKRVFNILVLTDYRVSHVIEA